MSSLTITLVFKVSDEVMAKFHQNPDLEMFGEHYGSLLASSGALVDLENELQSS
jgi:hypothetical protein